MTESTLATRMASILEPSKARLGRLAVFTYKISTFSVPKPYVMPPALDRACSDLFLLK